MIRTNKLWMNWSQRSAVGPIYQALVAGMVDLPGYLGLRWPLSILYFTPDQDGGAAVEWLVRWDDMFALGHEMLGLFSTTAGLDSFEAGWQARCAELVTAIGQVPSDEDLASLDADGLLGRYEELLACYRRMYGLGWFAEPVLMAGQRQLADAFERTATSLELPLPEVKKRLSHVDRPTFGALVLEELLAIAVAISQLDIGLAVAPSFTSMPAALQARLTVLSETYGWMENDYYETRVRSAEHFLAQAVAYLRDVPGPGRRLQELQDARALLDAQASAARASLSPYHRALSSCLARMASLQDDRKALIQQTNGIADRFLAEVARRTALPIEDVRAVLPEELPELLAGPEVMATTIAARRLGCVIVWSRLPVGAHAVAGAGMDHGLQRPDFRPVDWVTGHPEVVQGSGACEAVLNELDDRLHFSLSAGSDTPDELRGECVHMGSGARRIQGVARVVLNPARPGLFDKGDILVARSTTPDFVPLMHLAAAIVTDWGGWTSHAALCARDFDIPCVVDTGLASQLLRSGERIELDLESGVVRRLAAEAEAP